MLTEFKNRKLLLLGFFTGAFSALYGTFTESVLMLGTGAGVMLLCVALIVHKTKSHNDNEVESLV